MRRNLSARATIVSVLLAVEIIVVAAIVFAVAALSVGRFDRLSPAPPDAADNGLPSPTVSATDVNGVRFDMAFRGYRMAEVDAVLARLADELAWRDAELARRDEEMVRLATFAHFDHQSPGHQSPGRRSADRDDWSGHADAVSQTTLPAPTALPVPPPE
ncbi:MULTISPECIES: DivIVA domain-containing protein [unclassified Frankia]|uniref:DivIVA domain-containing protein n=1 Tax=unclassified Frankia TaxID=2632575 RepID=UPI002AD4EA85|nr:MULTISPECIES: DivIVA domain-containing protein [unclassified Frankia]